MEVETLDRPFEEILDGLRYEDLKPYNESTAEEFLHALELVGANVDGVLEKPVMWWVGHEGRLYTAKLSAQLSFPGYSLPPVEARMLSISEVTPDLLPPVKMGYGGVDELRSALNTVMDDFYVYAALLNNVCTALEPYDFDNPLSLLSRHGGMETDRMGMDCFASRFPEGAREAIRSRYERRAAEARAHFFSPSSGERLQEMALGGPATQSVEYALYEGHMEHDLSADLQRALVQYYLAAAVLDTSKEERSSFLPPPRKILIRAPRDILDYLDANKQCFERFSFLGTGPDVPDEVLSTALGLMEGSSGGILQSFVTACEAAVLVNR